MDIIDKDRNQITHGYLEDRDIDDNICVRFIRKKFKCIVIFLLFLITLLEFLNNVILRIDENFLRTFISMILSTNNNESTYEFV
jgi:hypothetical protein